MGWWGIFEEIKHDLGVNAGFSKRKVEILGLKGGLCKGKCMILGFRGGF